ncbi:1,4-alpha-glucan branching protein GlgB [Paenarthrobacter sp. DKR-5]|uniref:1,4-alpha-glucan branching protein GlgB n=1 Tax=Paenarthrobacter sp. DKR-5 TaxID=2835535 RepID=UPI001BDC98C7|nr:1,4-alpha-glucan branching protein GlgB [Paenarthrobacter sp. DKR-5]MBT1003635.1 1,4-alpha-glucan branching protein GlgB [Paenarthrobacter sp. DKR-5]
MTTEAALIPPLAELLSAWLPAQRWFPAKGQEAAVRLLGAIRLEDPAGAVGLEIQLVAVDAGDRTVVLNVPLSFRTEQLSGAELALVGQTGYGDLGTRWVYDAAHDPVFIDAWLDLMRSGTTTADGGAEGHASAALKAAKGHGGLGRSRVLTGEQSNTSVIVPDGDIPLILKFFRVAAAGGNPEVEVGAALTDIGCSEVPATHGWVTGRWQDATGKEVSGHLGVANEFVSRSEDAWRIASAAAAGRKDFKEAAGQLGEATAVVHQRLGQAFGSNAPDDAQRRTFLDALSRRITWEWAEVRTAVGPYDTAINKVLADLDTVGDLPELQRIHGDFHLGQVLYVPDSEHHPWRILDFEGEPLRPVAERHANDVALRDVVGMIRSFDYAAGSAMLAGLSQEAAVQWSDACKEAFLAGYRKVLPQSADPSGPLFRALWLDKALYEVIYELRNRPDWLKVPVESIRRELAPLQTKTTEERGASMMGEKNRVDETAPAQVPAQLPGKAAEPVQAAAPTPLHVDEDLLRQVADGVHHAPHAVLGAHLDDNGKVTVRTLRHLATEVSVVTATGSYPMEHEYGGIWAAVVEPEESGHVPDYRLEVTYGDGSVHTMDEPYRFLPTLGELDLHLIAEGRHETLWTVLGAHVRHYHSALGDIDGVSFTVWAPNAKAVRVIADFNSWDGRHHAMRSLGSSGVWEIFIPAAGAGSAYKFEILTRHGNWIEKADPMAFGTEVPPLTASRVVESSYSFKDGDWLAKRAASDPHNGPMSVYEVHLGSWRLGLGYEELAKELVEYVQWMGFTHVEFMPVAEHPFGGSWGYQVTSYYAPTSRFGHPDQFKHLVDALHQAGIGVIMDWVPAHFPKDSWALARFDGDPLYEHADPRLGEHPDWGTLIFDFGRREVRNFLVANALYWLEEFHIDGLRVDAVASMLYLDYSREAGQWAPNRFGGRENLEAISFLQEMSATAYKRNPGIVTIAEESTAFPGVTKPTSTGGLGFGLKWNMGWMHDSLGYIAEDPINRGWHHNQATFSLVYAFTENFLLPISHDEVVHGKGSMLRKMPGDRWQQLANLRAFLAFQWAHPGKQLIFMGTEFGQEAEWSEQYGLDWWLTETPQHRGLQLMVRRLNEIYQRTPALFKRDNEPAGFEWINANDAERNVLSFVRWDDAGNPLVCVVNFAGNPHHDFRVGMPREGVWTEVLNTDDEEFGGSGVTNGGEVEAVPEGWDGKPASAVLTLPPLGAVYLAPRKA